MNRALAAAALCAGALCALLASGCADLGPVAGSEIGNPTIAGAVLKPDGSPAAGATVILRRKDYLAKGIGEGLISTSILPEVWLAKRGLFDSRGLFMAETETDAEGRFHIDSVDTGSYRIEVNDGAEGLLIDVAVDSADKEVKLPVGSLGAVATLRGVLRTVDPAAGQYLAFVRGLERTVLVDRTTGAFTLPALPAGTYSVHFGCLDAGCLSRDVAGITVRAGEDAVMDTVVLATFASENYTAWKSSMKIALNTTASGADLPDTVRGFPLLVRLDSANFPFAGAGPRGQDVRFADALGNNLHFEIERWDSAARRAEIWVRLPAVHGNSDTQTLTLYWNNPEAAAYSSGVEVFPRAEGFRGVWHLAENGGSADNGYRDASANNNHGTGRALPNTPVGLLGPGQAFDGGSSVITAPDSTLHPDSGLTLEMWARFASLGPFRRLVSKAYPSGRFPWTEYGLESDADGRRITMALGLKDSLYGARSAREINADEWIHITGTYDGSQIRIYLDGVLEGAVERKGPISDYGRGLCFGKYEHDEASNFNGVLDEIRVTGTARPPAWIRLSYENQRPGSRLLSFSKPFP